MITHYNTCLNNILNSLAPVKTRSVSFSTTAPWYTPHLRSMKTKGRQLERLYKKTGLTIHKEMYIAHIHHYKDSISQAKTNHYSAQIISNEGNTRSLFTLLNRTLQPPDSLPPHLYSTDTCNSLMQFFNDKISNIHQHQRISNIEEKCHSRPTSGFSEHVSVHVGALAVEFWWNCNQVRYNGANGEWQGSSIDWLCQHLDSDSLPSPPPTLPLLSPTPLPHCQHFSSFQLPNDLQISDLIRKSKPSTCHLDPLPTTLVKSCLPSVLPLISAIIHSSLTTGTVPSP